MAFIEREEEYVGGCNERIRRSRKREREEKMDRGNNETIQMKALSWTVTITESLPRTHEKVLRRGVVHVVAVYDTKPATDELKRRAKHLFPALIVSKQTASKGYFEFLKTDLSAFRKIHVSFHSTGDREMDFVEHPKEPQDSTTLCSNSEEELLTEHRLTYEF
jgi:hypothetical protein